MLKLMKKNSVEQISVTVLEVKESEKVNQQEYQEISVESTDLKNHSIKQKENPITMNFLRQKPNFFIAFQVNNIEIHQKVKKLQENILVRNPLLYPALVNVSTLHVTLAVTHLANKNDIEIVKNKLDEWATTNKKKYFHIPFVLTFKGVKTFKNTVAYVDIQQCENYKKLINLAGDMNNILYSLGCFVESKSYTPHLTFLKLSKDIKLLKMKKHFIEDFEYLKNYNEPFGNQEICQLQLLSMDEPKDEFGYYSCFHEIKVANHELNVDHNE